MDVVMDVMKRPPGNYSKRKFIICHVVLSVKINIRPDNRNICSLV
jgi:hypothetical protein